MILMLVLALTLLLVAGALLFVTLLLSRGARRSRENRVSLVFAGFKPASTAGLTGGLLQLSITAERLRRVLSLGLAHNWGTQASTTKLLLIAAFAALIVWALAALVLHFSVWIAAPATGFAFVLLPRLVLKREQGKAEKQFTNYFPDAVDMGVRMLRAGLPITSAIRAIANEATPPVNRVFKTLADQVEIGIAFEEALASTAERIGLADFKFFAVAVSLQNATGGNLATTLETISDIMRKRRAVRLKAKATSAEARVSAYILGAMPFLVTGVLLLIQPGYLAPLLTDRRGNMLLAGALIGLLVGFMTMRQMMRSAIRL
jgi:tight adherence protein B